VSTPRPVVSVVVAAYNGEAHVGETIAAILGQTRAPDEVVVVDDGSTDGTVDVLASFGDAIQVFHQHNSGAAGAYAHAYARARGDWVARCDADDVWLPQKLERQLDALAARPEIDVVVTGATVFGRGPERPFSALPPADGLDDPLAFARHVYRANPICSSTALIRAALLKDLPAPTPRLPCEDYELWLHLLRAGARFHWDPEALVRYRQHAGNVTNNRVAMERSALAMHRAFADLPQDRALVGRTCARDLATIGRLLADAGDDAQARAAFAGSLRARPTAFALAWALLLSLPRRLRRRAVGAALALVRGERGRAEAAA
jgi:glycosyltransferase involved in cell wall biosynthesis